MEYDNTNRGTLGKNKRKTEETNPEYAGQINIEGVEYWLSGWVKANRETGEKFFSLRVKPKEFRPTIKPKESKPEGWDSMADDVPFK